VAGGTTRALLVFVVDAGETAVGWRSWWVVWPLALLFVLLFFFTQGKYFKKNKPNVWQ
jgi:hypothetical protein